MTREITPPRWALPGGIAAVALTGLAVTGGLLVADGRLISLPPKMRVFHGLANWAWIGLIPLVGAVAMWRSWKRDDRPAVVVSLAASAVLFVGLTAAFPLLEVDRRKATKELVAEAGARQLDREVRVGSFKFTTPSLTFYVGRRVERFADPPAAAEFLAFPIESYLFVPDREWPAVEAAMKTPHRVLARRYDYDENGDVLVVTNR